MEARFFMFGGIFMTRGVINETRTQLRELVLPVTSSWVGRKDGTHGTHRKSRKTTQLHGTRAVLPPRKCHTGAQQRPITTRVEAR
jgi:hypothetical protein